MVKHIEMRFAQYDRAMLDARFLCGSWAFCRYWCHCFNSCVTACF